jgi:hypothetical protein
MNQNTQDFLAALLSIQQDEFSDYTVYDFSNEFVAGAEKFVSGFREHMEGKGAEIPEMRNFFGANVFLGLSGCGAGFFDDEETEPLQAALEDFSGDKYRFEQIELYVFADGKIDLSFLPGCIDMKRNELFEIKN